VRGWSKIFYIIQTKLQSMGIEGKIKSLSPDLQKEVDRFIDSLIRKKKKEPSFSWAGALREYRDRFTPVELQKRALEWR